MSLRKDFSPFVPVGEWYEYYWLRPEPVKQSTGFRRPGSVMTMVHRATQFAYQRPAWVQRRDDVAPGSNRMLASSVFHGAGERNRGGN
jgi:hypothetical protein